MPTAERPSISISPSVGSSNPAIIRSVVVLPQPDGPSSARNSPGCTSRSMRSTATRSPNRFVTPRSTTSGFPPRSMWAEHTERTARVSREDKRSRPSGQAVELSLVLSVDGAVPAPRPSPPPSGGIARGGREAAYQPEKHNRGVTKEQSMDPDRVVIFDTTLRDGEQSPGISLNTTEKLEIAHQLARLGVDVIEAGFPAASPGDFEAVQAIAREVRGPVVAGLARAHAADIERAAAAVRDAERGRIHTFISTSDIHIEHQLQSTREDVKGSARAAVAHARSLADDVEFSPMDATRADVEFTAAVLQAAIDEGATTINIPDTVGYAMPLEYAAFLGRLYELVPDLRNVVLSVHCHDDLGLAVANSFAGVQAGARQVECAINGIGERAGNASLEEIVMLLETRKADIGLATGITTREIARTSRMISRLTGYPVQPNKAIVGRNAFAHEAGIHQDGVLKERSTYEIMEAGSVGVDDVNSIVLGKHSGRHALRAA